MKHTVTLTFKRQCDEQHPACAGCIKRDIACKFLPIVPPLRNGTAHDGPIPRPDLNHDQAVGTSVNSVGRRLAASSSQKNASFAADLVNFSSGSLNQPNQAKLLGVFDKQDLALVSR